MVEQSIVTAPFVSLLYAVILAVDAGFAVLTGWAYDRLGPKVLLALPLVAALVPMFAFTGSLPAVIAGALL